MFNDKNYLSKFRKRTDITQSDIGFLLNMPDNVTICRYEQGERKPPVEMVLLYHLLFDVPMQSLFEIQKDNLNEDLIVRIRQLINELKQHAPSQRIRSRIAFLMEALSKLTA
jgi:transcriptional regulator with XRE-family HTH domain